MCEMNTIRNYKKKLTNCLTDAKAIVNVLRESHKGVLRKGIVPVLWVDIVIVPERSEWDIVRAG
jgi:hypothetical protein